MDSESLDCCIQTTLAALYPPFQATSRTVLCQVLSVVEHCYRGDGLRYLLHFLLPAKQLLQNLQQDACLQYCGLLFRHEGWPLCVHEKVVVQLCPLDQRLLHPGDFYLLVSPTVAPPLPARRASCRGSVAVSPHLLLCSVSASGHHVEQQEVSEIALRSLFSMAWLDSVNRERERRGASRLERCVLSAHGDVFRVPWEDLVYPQFVTQPRTAPKENQDSSAKNGKLQDEDTRLLPSPTTIDQSQVSSEAEDSEGEYVELMELPLPRFSPQKGSLTQSISLQHRARTSTHISTHTAIHTATNTSTHRLTHTTAPTATHTATHTSSTHTHTSAAATHTPQISNTHSAAVTHTHSSTPSVEVSACTALCSRLMEENLNQDHSRSVDLTTVFSSSSSAPPQAVESISCLSGGPEGTNPCIEQRDGEEGEKQRKEEVTEEEQREQMERRLNNVVSADIGKEKEEEEEVQRVEGMCRSDEKVVEGEETDTDGDEQEELDEDGGDELEKEGAEEVEVVEEVQVIIMLPSPERKEEQLTTREKRDAQQAQLSDCNILKMHCNDSYFEINPQETNSGDFYSEKTPHTHPEDYAEESLLHPKDFYSNKNKQAHLEDCTESTLLMHTVDSYFEKETLETHTEDCLQNKTQVSRSECSQHPEDPYSEKDKPKTQMEDTYVCNADQSYFENDTQQACFRDSYFENTPSMHSEDSDVKKDTLKLHTEGSYSKKDPLLTHTEDSYFEKKSHKACLEDSCSENTLPVHPDDCFCEKESSAGGSNECEMPQSVSSVVPEPCWTDPQGSDRVQEQKKGDEDEEEEHNYKEAAQTEGLSSSLTVSASPAEPAPPASAAPAVQVRLTQSSQCGFYSVLLKSGAVCLPGTTDRSRRPLLTVSTWNSVWSHPDCDSAELLRLLLYYISTLRKETRALGLTVLVDACRAAPAPALFSTLRSLQTDTPGSIHTVLILANKDSSLHVDRTAATQVELLSSLKALQKHVELHQLPTEFGGSFSFSQNSWLSFRARVEQLTNQCEDVISLLQKTINILQSAPLPAAAKDAELQLVRYRAVMHSILEDSRLVQLQQEGGASLSRLRREDGCEVTEEHRAAVEMVSSLYDQVDELLHRLVTLSNSRTQELNFIVDFKSLEQGFSQVQTWLQEVGEIRLKSLEEPEDSLELLKHKQQDFKDFHTLAYENCKRGEALLARLERWDNVSTADLHVYEVKVHSFWAQLQDFSQRVNSTGKNIERAVRLYRFLDQAYGWALEGMRHLAGVSMEECMLPEKCQAVIGCLEEYQREHPAIPDSRFQEMKVEAGALRAERGLRQWSFAWTKCQETKKMFDRKMEAALRTRDSAHRRRSDSVLSQNSTSSRLSGLWGVLETSSFPPEEDTSASPPTPQHTPLLQRLFRSSSEESSDRMDVCSSGLKLRLTSSSPSSLSCSRRQQLRKTQSFDCPSTPEVLRYSAGPRALSEPACRGNTGVFIRGLEVSSTEAADHTLCPRTPVHGCAGQGTRSPGTPGTPKTHVTPGSEPRPRGSKLRHIVEEMVTTEREYVRSLRYIIHHYFPEMDRVDVPQDLRGKRSVVFGNLEKLLDFHSQFFLRELEACWKHPLRVPHCFLRHQEQFSLYALYSKNKPKSDALLANHGHSFFRRKQLELGDKMDLSSYLLKPIQRMSKYALLLTDLIKEVGVAQEAELVALQAATSMVKFQLRHGNDLLAMDAIKDCDVNLKEQGQLIRQDEFTVWSGRRKCQRHIFLFEELILFSKPKKMEGGLDVFIYKHSFKTADVGLTESTGDSGLKFEIWFRRRTSRNQTFILQAAMADIRHAWTSDITRILWAQATKNKEMRLKEMVSMGVGNKPFLDIQPSDAAISDRAVHYIMKSRGARTRASIAVSVFDHSNPFKHGAVTSDPAVPGPSSSSLLGPLNLHMYSQTLPSTPPHSDASFSASCIEEDEQEHETSSQPSMTTESSGSSSRCLSGSTGSDSGCVSSNLPEALPDEPSPPSSSSSSSNKQHLRGRYISSENAAVISPATMV